MEPPSDDPIIAPPYNSDGEYLFGSTGVPVEVDYNYLDWKHLSTINYDAPWINYVNPQTGNAQGQEICAPSTKP